MDELMLFSERVTAPDETAITGVLALPFERRQRPRQRAALECGREIGLLLQRGTVLRGGDRLKAETGEIVAVVAAPEAVSTVRCSDTRQLARIAYHLGNRHVALEVGDGWVRYAADHVLDDMVRGLGAAAIRGLAPFEPEAGAYSAEHSHSSGHS